MKKVFNLAVIFAALLLGTTFTSCSEDDEPAVVDIQVVATPGTDGINLAGIISSDNKLDDIVILNSDGTTAKTITLDANKVKEDGQKYFIYTINETLSNFDVYTIKATDANANESTKTFGEKFTSTLGNNASTYGSFLSIKDGAVYTLSQVNAGNGANVEIVYNGTTLISADQVTNTTINTNGKSATITTITGGYLATTNTGYYAIIKGDNFGSQDVSIVVIKIEGPTVQ